MRRRETLPAVVALAAVATFVVLAAGAARAARQNVAFFPLQNLADNTMAGEVAQLGLALKDKLQDRLDVQMVPFEAAHDAAEARKKARGLGAPYVLTGAVSRIGRTITLDLTLSATEDPAKGRTVVVNALDADTYSGKEMRPAFRRMAIEAAARLKYLFFGDEVVLEGAARRTVPKLGGTISRSRNIEGNVVSVAWTDADRDGKKEVIGAYPDRIAVYRIEGDDLYEKAVIHDPGDGLFHVDAADLNGNGSVDIVAVRYVAGKALSDVWEYDGKEYRRIAVDLPYFTRTLDLGKEGISLVGQESDPVSIFKGPVVRLALSRFVPGGDRKPGAALPLPEGTWIYAFATLKKDGGVRYAVLGEMDRLILLDATGKKLWEGVDAVSGTETFLDAPIDASGRLNPAQGGKRLYLPNRLFAVDLVGDRNDELIVLNNLVTAGGFFESLRVFSNAEALCFAQKGDSLQLAWRTPQAGASARDAFLDVARGGRSLRIGVASIDKGKILGQYGEWRILWLK